MGPPWTDEGVPYSPIPPPAHPQFDLKKLIKDALDEDSVNIGDLTTLATVPSHSQAIGTFLAKADGVLAGLAVAQEVFRVVDPSLTVEWSQQDSKAVSSGESFGTVRGNSRSLLVAERVALNFLQRMSGIATATHTMSLATKAILEAISHTMLLKCCIGGKHVSRPENQSRPAFQGTRARIIETRKTVPGLRVLDKWAVLIGGGSNHRMGLFDMILVKDNHVTAAGGITAAVKACQEYLSSRAMNVPVEIETRTLEEVEELMGLLAAGKANGVTRIMLDNMAKINPNLPGGVDVSLLRKAVAEIDGRLETEASGNVTLGTVAEIAKTGVDFISCGALTHSVTALDISLKIKLQDPQ